MAFPTFPLGLLHTTQTAKVWRPTTTTDEGREDPVAIDPDNPTFTMLVAIVDGTDEIKRGFYGADVEDVVKILSKDRTSFLKDKDVIEVVDPAGNTNRYEVKNVTTRFRKSQQAVGIRRATK